MDTDLSKLNNKEREKLINDLALREAMGLTGQELNRRNPFLGLSKEELDNPSLTILRFMRNPDFFYFTCKYLFNINLFPYQCVILVEMWNHPFPMLIGSRGMAKSLLLGLYSLLRATFIQGRKIIIMGAGFRQAKAVYNYAESRWNNSPVFRSLFDGEDAGIHHGTDMWTINLGESLITALPQGDGEKIRGQRCNDLIVDEFKSIDREIFDEVAMGFGIVSSDPFEKVKSSARVRVLKKMGLWNEDMEENRRKGVITNQTIVSGTAYYQFNHFYTEYMKYKHIIESNGDQEYIKEKTGKKLEAGLDWRDYLIIKMPANMLPEDYMDAKIIAKMRMSSTTTSFLNEVMACFSTDTNGFYKMTLLQSCTTEKPVQVGESEELVQFRAMLEGDPTKEYVIGVDPASEQDNLAIVLLELNGTHRRIVYVWTTNNKQFKKQIEKGYVNPDFEYYGYCVRKIRTLMKKFNIVHIALDSQGGGTAIRNGLADKKLIEDGELPIYPLKSNHPLGSDKYKDTDNKSGLHILELVSFASAEWTSEANHGMRFDFETRKLLFPKFDHAYLAQQFELNNLAYQKEEEFLKMDTLDDCYDEIEKLKEETSTIEIRPTPMGKREKWDTPEDKASGKKGRQYKDRFCALLMANAAGRSVDTTQKKIAYEPMGGFVGSIKAKDNTVIKNEPLYRGPDWFTKEANNRKFYGGVVIH